VWVRVLLFTITSEINHLHFPRNRLSPRFINKAKRPNRYIVMRRSSYKQIKDKQQKQRSIKLTTEAVRKLRKPELHDNAPKEVTTQQAPSSPRPQRPRGFHPEPYCGEGSHNDSLKRITTPLGVVIVGAKALRFLPEKPSPRQIPQQTSQPRAELIPRNLGTHHVKALPAPRTLTPTPRHPHGSKGRPSSLPHHPAVKPPVQSTFRHRCPNIRELVLM
jgi:hypothetical protein